MITNQLIEICITYRLAIRASDPAENATLQSDVASCRSPHVYRATISFSGEFMQLDFSRGVSLAKFSNIISSESNHLTGISRLRKGKSEIGVFDKSDRGYENMWYEVEIDTDIRMYSTGK